MLKFFLFSFFSLISAGFSSGIYCIFNNFDKNLSIRVYPNGYSVTQLENGISKKITDLSLPINLETNKGIIFEALRNYTTPNVAQLEVSDSTNQSQIATLNLQMQTLKNEKMSQFSVGQLPSSQYLIDKIQVKDPSALWKYASNSHSTIVLSQ